MADAAGKLVKMSGQIATFFESQTGDQVGGVAEHINLNWSPQMRRDLKMQSGLHPLVQAALEQIRD